VLTSLFKRNVNNPEGVLPCVFSHVWATRISLGQCVGVHVGYWSVVDYVHDVTVVVYDWWHGKCVRPQNDGHRSVRHEPVHGSSWERERVCCIRDWLYRQHLPVLAESVAAPSHIDCHAGRRLMTAVCQQPCSQTSQALGHPVWTNSTVAQRHLSSSSSLAFFIHWQKLNISQMTASHSQKEHCVENLIQTCFFSACLYCISTILLSSLSKLKTASYAGK